MTPERQRQRLLELAKYFHSQACCRGGSVWCTGGGFDFKYCINDGCMEIKEEFGITTERGPAYYIDR